MADVAAKVALRTSREPALTLLPRQKSIRVENRNFFPSRRKITEGPQSQTNTLGAGFSPLAIQKLHVALEKTEESPWVP